MAAPSNTVDQQEFQSWGESETGRDREAGAVSSQALLGIVEYYLGIEARIAQLKRDFLIVSRCIDENLNPQTGGNTEVKVKEAAILALLGSDTPVGRIWREKASGMPYFNPSLPPDEYTANPGVVTREERQCAVDAARRSLSKV